MHSSLVSFSSVQFSSVQLLSRVQLFATPVSLGKFIFRYFILFIAMVNGIDSLISLSDFLLLVYRNESDFCIDFVSRIFAKFTD